MAKILVVDDDPQAAAAVAFFMKMNGNEIVTKYKPADAIAALDEQAFDMVITDRQMHGDEDAGFAVVEAARAKGDMPVAMFTAAGDSAAARARLSAIGGNTQVVDKSNPEYGKPLLAMLNNRESGKSRGR